MTAPLLPTVRPGDGGSVLVVDSVEGFHVRTERYRGLRVTVEAGAGRGAWVQLAGFAFSPADAHRLASALGYAATAASHTGTEHR
ncbi:MAG: hypothetical protein ACR2KJ_11190 [Jatrophihabitans sp.]